MGATKSRQAQAALTTYGTLILVMERLSDNNLRGMERISSTKRRDIHRPEERNR